VRRTDEEGVGKKSRRSEEESTSWQKEKEKRDPLFAQGAETSSRGHRSYTYGQRYSYSFL